ncbi:unnamed protein product [Rotaria socialis]|uniref:G-protein coupled receptors family 1 profile domain-containing protein n=3 Tax=Rotaria socialis TaxID=392032 RepID=A0A820TBR8_9BILA|nr:unnamed protein product [Rotaria socialis]CAF4467618.1 unnamed protein product [Rotaria socialis]
MTTENIPTLVSISQYITLYVGSAIFIAGVIGSFLNIIIFLGLRTFRENSCVFYLIFMSFVNIGNLMAGLLSRIMISGFKLDWTLISPVYCKLRWYGLQFGVLTSFTCTCLAAIDQYMCTNARLEWRQWSTTNVAHRLILIMTIAWLLHGVPYLIYFNLVQAPITGGISCASDNLAFQQYHTYGYLIILAGVIPLIITCIFGLLARNNVHQLAHRTVPLVQRSLDKQLTNMVLHQILFNFIFTFPYTFHTILTSFPYDIKDPDILAKLDFVNVITILFYYLSFAGPFYIYTCTSERFRQQIIYVLLNVHLKRWQRPIIQINQVAPTSHENP